MSVLFALAAAVGWGSSDYAGGHASRRSSAVSVVILTHLASMVALIVIATMPGQTGSPAVADLLWGLAAGLGGGVGAMLLFSGLGKGSMSVVAPITAVGAASIPVLAGLVQGESLGLLGVLGILLALVAIVLVSLCDDEADDQDGATDDGADPPAPPEVRLLPERSEPSDAEVASTIASMEQDFVPEPVGAAPAGALREEHGQTVPVGLPPTMTLNDFAAAIHEQRDAFEIARMRRGRPTAPVGAWVATHPAPVAAAVAVPPKAGTPRRSIAATIRSILRQPGVVEALFSGIGFGLFFVFIARTSEQAGHWPLVSARFISVVMFAAGAIIALSAVMPERESRPAVVLAGALDAAAAVFFVLSTRSGLLAVGAVLASLYPAVTVLLARFHGKEPITRRQLAGLVLAGIAVSFLAI